MKTTRYTLLAAALLLAASCANDPVEDIINPSAPGTALPGGTFVIDYAAGMEGADTRSDANQRIQSLDYLIYQSATKDGDDYTLLKKRSIPDIGPDTPWPLTRDNMTWEQREALKDTLSTSHYYKMVFVANANDTIWNEKDTPEESMFHALQNVVEGSNFNDGRLVLPPRVFTENDMYYMWTGAVTPSEADENKTVNRQVLLQRVINKVEVKLDENIPTDETELNTYINNLLTSYFENMSSKDGEHIGTLFTNLQKAMETFTRKFESTEYKTYIEALQTYITKDESINKIFADINNEEKYSTSALESGFINQLNKIVTPMLQWEKTKTAQITFKENTWASSIDFTMTSVANKETNKDPINYSTEEKRYFIFYCFGNNTLEDGLNQIEKIEFYNEEKTNPLFSISGIKIPSYKAVKGNNHILLTCKPLDGIDDSKTYIYTLQNYKLKDILGWTKDDIGYPFETGLSRLENDINKALSPEGLNNMTLTFNVPCEIVSSWNNELVQPKTSAFY